MVAFEGDTGPYLCYAHARIQSIFRRLGDEATSFPTTWSLAEPAARSLAVGLLSFPEALEATLNTVQPHRLANYLFDVAQRFTSFYEACPVLSVDGDLRAERIALCRATAQVLSVGLSLLGISAPDQM